MSKIKISKEQLIRFCETDIRWEKGRIKQLKKDVKKAENEARYKKIWIKSYEEKLQQLKEKLKNLKEKDEK